MVPKSLSNFDKNRKNIFSTIAQRHLFMLYLHDVKYFYLYHLFPQMISNEGIALEFLLQNRAIKTQLSIENDEIHTRASRLIYYPDQTNFSCDVVFLGFICDEYLFELVNFLAL